MAEIDHFEDIVPSNYAEAEGAEGDAEDAEEGIENEVRGGDGKKEIATLKKQSKYDIIFKNLGGLVKSRGDDEEEFKKYVENFKTRNKGNDMKSIEIPTGKVPTIPKLYSKNICVLLMIDSKQEYKKVFMSRIKEINENPTEENLKSFFEDHKHKKQYIFIFLKGKPINTNDRNMITRFDKLLMKSGCISHDFTEDRFMYNPLEHIYVPHHRKLNKEEEAAFMYKYLIDPNSNTVKSLEMRIKEAKSKLTIILKTDPIAKWIGLKTGDIVEITRQSPTSGTHMHYRVCL